jgi:PD-(D/E)XK endonuclease
MTTDQKGAIAEAAIALAAIKLGIGVFKPLGDERYDLILDLRPQLLRVQCKTGCLGKGVVIIRCYSFRRTRDGYIKRGYSSVEVDAIAAYCLELDRCFLLPIDLAERRPTLALRVEPTRNNQRRGINWADDFDFAATLGHNQGAVAQLGERQSGTLKVTGSSPVGSTLITSR